MSGYLGVGRRVMISVGMLALCVPTVTLAQTAEQRAKEQELQARMDELRALRSEQMARVEEALARAREQLERAATEARRTGEQEEQYREQVSQYREQIEQYREQMDERLRQLRAQEAEVASLGRERLRQERLTRQELEERVQEQAQRVQEREARLQERVEAARRSAEEAVGQARDRIRMARQIVVRARARVRLGISLNARQGGEYDAEGARVEGVLEDSPAEKAGLEEGDIITLINGQSLLEPIPGEADEDFNPNESMPVQRLLALAGRLEPGQEVDLKYLRDGAPHSLTLTAADLDQPALVLDMDTLLLRGVLPDTVHIRGLYRDSLRLGRLFSDSLRLRELIPDTARLRELLPDTLRLRGLLESMPQRRGREPLVYEFRRGAGLWGGELWHGLELAPMNARLGEYFSTPSGVLVLDVDADSTLALQPGDVILSIGGRSVEDPSDVRRILSSYEEDESVSFTIMRKGQRIDVEGAMG